MTANAKLVDTVRSIAAFAVGHNDVSEIIAQRLRKALSDYEKESPDGWISVESRLPELKEDSIYSEDVLVYAVDRDKSEDGAIIETGCLFRKKKINQWAIGESSAYDYEDGIWEVTHWMSLPVAPRLEK